MVVQGTCWFLWKILNLHFVNKYINKLGYQEIYGLFQDNGLFKMHRATLEKWWEFSRKALYWYSENTASVKSLKNGSFKLHTEAFSLHGLHVYTYLYALQLVPLMSMQLHSWMKLYSLCLNRSYPAHVHKYCITISSIHTNGKVIPCSHIYVASPDEQILDSKKSLVWMGSSTS